MGEESDDDEEDSEEPEPPPGGPGGPGTSCASASGTSRGKKRADAQFPMPAYEGARVRERCLMVRNAPAAREVLLCDCGVDLTRQPSDRVGCGRCGRVFCGLECAYTHSTGCPQVIEIHDSSSEEPVWEDDSGTPEHMSSNSSEEQE